MQKQKRFSYLVMIISTLQNLPLLLETWWDEINIFEQMDSNFGTSTTKINDFECRLGRGKVCHTIRMWVRLPLVEERGGRIGPKTLGNFHVLENFKFYSYHSGRENAFSLPLDLKLWYPGKKRRFRHVTFTWVIVTLAFDSGLSFTPLDVWHEQNRLFYLLLHNILFCNTLWLCSIFR